MSFDSVVSEEDDHDSSCNVIPLPPKDPRAVQQLTAPKPRHQRKYPLVIPNSLSQPLNQANNQHIVDNLQNTSKIWSKLIFWMSMNLFCVLDFKTIEPTEDASVQNQM